MRTIVTLAASALFACGGYPIPVQGLANAQSAEREARAAGAESVPQAKLHLLLARESIARAHALIDDGDNERADFELRRAQADAELALAETRESDALASARAALREIDALQRGTSTTTTTGATTKEPEP